MRDVSRANLESRRHGSRHAMAGPRDGRATVGGCDAVSNSMVLFNQRVHKATLNLRFHPTTYRNPVFLHRDFLRYFHQGRSHARVGEGQYAASRSCRHRSVREEMADGEGRGDTSSMIRLRGMSELSGSLDPAGGLCGLRGWRCIGFEIQHNRPG